MSNPGGNNERPRPHDSLDRRHPSWSALFAFRFWRVSSRESFASISSIQESQGKPIEVTRASRGDLEVWTSLAGTVEGSFQYPVISTNSIAVTGVAKKEGDRVRAGDVLIRLEKGAPNPMLLSYNRSLVLFEDALADAERMRALYKEGGVSKQALDKAELALAVAKGRSRERARRHEPRRVSLRDRHERARQGRRDGGRLRSPHVDRPDRFGQGEL